MGRPTPLALRVVFLYGLAILGFYMGISKTGPWYVVHALPFLSIAVALWLASLQVRGASTATFAYVALALSLLFWLAPPLAGYNPFARSAIGIAMPIHWRGLFGASPLAAALASAAVLFVILLALRRWLGPRLLPPLALTLTLLFVGYALVRSLLPLAYVDYLSPVAAMAADLDERRQAGQPIPLPLELPPAHPWTVHYYFGRDYRMRVARDQRADTPPARSRFVLVEAVRPGSTAGSRVTEGAPSRRR
jgi:hypothetical protein